MHLRDVREGNSIYSHSGYVGGCHVAHHVPVGDACQLVIVEHVIDVLSPSSQSRTVHHVSTYNIRLQFMNLVLHRQRVTCLRY
jgi:hypothetical protein